MKQVDLKFGKLITSLAGNRYGRETYKNQVSQYVSEDVVVAMLPEVIEDIASSFLAGFYSELSEKFGFEKAHEMVIIQSSNSYINEKIAAVRETYGV